MQHLTVDGVLGIVTLGAQAALAYLMIKRGSSRDYPILLTYMFFNLVEDPLAWMLQNAPFYPKVYFTITVLDYVLQFLIILEIGRNVFRPSKRSLPFRLWPVVTGGILVCAILAATFSPQVQSGGNNAATHTLLRVTLGLAILKLLLFASMAGFAQFLGIGWKSRVLQLASALAFYGAVSLLVQLSSSHLPSTSTSYTAHLVRLAQIQWGAYGLTVISWIWAFSQNESPRKDFTPQMQEVLVTIAGAAKRTRLAVTRSADHK
jgi:hypothetical protein